MTHNVPQKDLIALVADADMRAIMSALFARWGKIYGNFNCDIFSHPHRDNGVYLRSVEFLSLFHQQYRYGLVMFDRHGCGGEGASREELEHIVESCFANTAWAGRVAAVVLDPELESWVWSDSPHVATELGWPEGTPALRSWLQQRELWPEKLYKPPDPKRALREALRKVQQSTSASLFDRLATRVSINRCSDPSFHKISVVIKTWFLGPTLSDS